MKSQEICSSSSSTSNVFKSNQETNTIKSITINESNNSSVINDNDKNGKIKDTKIKENATDSIDNKSLNEKIIKLLIGNHPLLPMKTIEKIAHCNFMNDHYKSKDFYNVKVIDEIIRNENSHIVAEFKDYLINGDISEFLQQYYKIDESRPLLPKIFEYYISCSVIFPNYVILPESQYIYKNIQRKQRVIDIQQEQEDKEENIKKGIFEQEKEPTVFNTQAFDSILNQTDTSGIKQFFGVPVEASGEYIEKEMMKLVNEINDVEKTDKINNKKRKCSGLQKFNFFFNKNQNLVDEKNLNKNHQESLSKKSIGGNLYLNNINYNNNFTINNNCNKIGIKKEQTQQNDNISNSNNNNNLSTKKKNITIQSSIGDINQYGYVIELKWADSIQNNNNTHHIKNNSINSNSKNNNEKEKHLNKNNSQMLSCNKSSHKVVGDISNNYLNHDQSKKNIHHMRKNSNCNNNYYNNNNKSVNQSVNKYKSYKNTIQRFFNKINNGFDSVSIKNNNINNNNNNNDSKNKKSNKYIINEYKNKNNNNNRKNQGNQTTRNKLENKNMLINEISNIIIKTNKSNNQQSLDLDINNGSKIKTFHKVPIKQQNNLKKTLINALLSSGNINDKKIKKNYAFIQNDYSKTTINASVNEISNKGNNMINKTNQKNNNNIDKESEHEKVNNENCNNNNINNMSKEKKNYKNNYYLLLCNEKSISHSKRVFSSSNIDIHGKVSGSSSTKAMSINPYSINSKKNINNNNTYHHKRKSKQIIQNVFPETKAFTHKNSKKNFGKEIVEEPKKKSKDFTKNNNNVLLEECPKSNNINFNDSQKKNNSQERKKQQKELKEVNDLKKSNIKNNNNSNVNPNDQNEINQNKQNYINFGKKFEKKHGSPWVAMKYRGTPKNCSMEKTISHRYNKSTGVPQYNHDKGPLSARESQSKFHINSGMIELLSNKIQRIKQSIKQTTDKGSNSISSIFKKKKIPSASRKVITGVVPKNDDNKKQIISKTRNKKNNRTLVGGTISNSNNCISGNFVNSIISSIYQTNSLSPYKENNEYDKIIKTFHKFQKQPTGTTDINSNNNNYFYSNVNNINSCRQMNYNNNILNNNTNNNNINNNIPHDIKKEQQKKKKHERCNSIYNNYDTHLNIEVNIKNSIKGLPKKSIINNKHINGNNLNINFNNYTNNYNYNYNISSTSNLNNNINNNYNNQINNNNQGNNKISYLVEKSKSNSQKIIMGSINNNNKNPGLKGFHINGFENLISKKYNTRNVIVPMPATDRTKKNNLYSTSIQNNINTNTNRYTNLNSNNLNVKLYYQKKINDQKFNINK